MYFFFHELLDFLFCIALLIYHFLTPYLNIYLCFYVISIRCLFIIRSICWKLLFCYF